MLARPLQLLRPTSFLVGAGLLAYAGCSSSAATTVAVTHPTMIEVSPEDFLGNVPCATEGQGLKRYVATLFDLNVVGGASAFAGSAGTSSTIDTDSSAGGSAGSAVAAPFQLPSSLPTPCVTAVGFGFVTAGRRYEAQIDGFDTDDLKPRALGARQMVKASDDTVPVVPVWSARCNRGIAVDLTLVRADDCTPFLPPTRDANGSLSISLSPLLGSLRCGSGAGQVDHFAVSLSSPAGAEPIVQDVSCSARAEAVFDELAPGQLVSAYVTAFSADGETAFAGANCSARTLPGANVPAQCSALSQTGTLRVDLVAALAQLGRQCSHADVNRLQISVPGTDDAPIVSSPACLQPFDQGFPAGAAALTVTALRLDENADPVELGSLTCHGEVAPGQVATAQCEPNTAK